MEFGWLNWSGALIVALLLLPNLLFALRGRGGAGGKEPGIPKLVLFLEQIGRYGSMALTVLPPAGGKLGFRSAEAFVIWAALCAALLLGYYTGWAVWFRAPSPAAALWLAILPGALFILRGIFLRHWLLTAFGAVFAAAHIYITQTGCRQPQGEAGRAGTGE